MFFYLGIGIYQVDVNLALANGFGVNTCRLIAITIGDKVQFYIVIFENGFNPILQDCFHSAAAIKVMGVYGNL